MLLKLGDGVTQASKLLLDLLCNLNNLFFLFFFFSDQSGCAAG